MYLRSFLLALGLSALVTAVPIDGNSASTELPTIDLGYAVHKASYYNESYDAYVFSNIRFAAPPTGSLRFGAPEPPLEDRSTVHNGSVGYDCPQGLPDYIQAIGGATPLTNVNEDCLFLDVIVPRKVLSGDYGEVPVLFWIYGGGYTFGSKTQQGDPINFLKSSPSPVIYVAANYRLGAFGWLGGPTFTLSEGTVPNAGLYDQRFALKWVQKYIHLFSGSKDEVTLMGVSAGGSSVMHQITAYGGRGESLFKRAIPVDIGYNIRGGHAVAEAGYKSFEEFAGCSGKGVECLRAIPSEAMLKFNSDFIRMALAPNFGYGPIVDGDFVQDAPQYLLRRGLFQKDVTVLVADDIDEGSLFTGNETALTTSYITTLSPGVTKNVVAEIFDLYPPPSSSTPYTTEKGRLIKYIADNGFNCNRYAISTALPNSTYNLLTSILPGNHGTWTFLIFGDLPESESVKVIDTAILEANRRFVMNFVVGGTPNELPASQGGNGTGIGPERVVWPVFGEEGKGLNVTGKALEVVSATGDKEVCEFWIKSLVLT